MSNLNTHIAVILDRSGSMEALRDDTIGGFNSFLSQQQAAEGRATLTLVQFDSQDSYEVRHDFVPLKDVPPLDRSSYVPRASTPLLDALGRGINSLDARLDALAPEERPAKVVMVIITDGQENASREFGRKEVMRMIKEKQSVRDWQFLFLSSDLEAVREARELGVRSRTARLFEPNAQGAAQAWRFTDQFVSACRSPQPDSKSFGRDFEDSAPEEEADPGHPRWSI